MTTRTDLHAATLATAEAHPHNIRVTRTFPDGYVEAWTQAGDTERRLKQRRRYDRQGPGWAEQDRTITGFGEFHGVTLTYVERIEWLGGGG